MTARSKSPRGDRPAVCLKCGELISLVELRVAMAQQVDYKHSCGRLLWSAAYGDH